MRRFGLGIAAGAFALAGAVPTAMAQELNEVCPDSPDGTGALWGAVMDEDGEMGLPGAGVVVTWEVDGEEGGTEGQTAFDGGYVLCYVPLEVALAVQPTFGNAGGSVTAASLTDPITRMDLVFSLAGAAGGGGDDDRIWACFGVDDNAVNLTYSRLLRCDPGWQGLNRCPKEEELGQVQATISGASRAAEAALSDDTNERDRAAEVIRSGEFREALEKVLADARRLGANALINWRQTRNSLTAEAVTVGVDPETCR